MDSMPVELGFLLIETLVVVGGTMFAGGLIYIARSEARIRMIEAEDEGEGEVRP